MASVLVPVLTLDVVSSTFIEGNGSPSDVMENLFHFYSRHQAISLTNHQDILGFNKNKTSQSFAKFIELVQNIFLKIYFSRTLSSYFDFSFGTLSLVFLSKCPMSSSLMCFSSNILAQECFSFVRSDIFHYV